MASVRASPSRQRAGARECVRRGERGKPVSRLSAFVRRRHDNGREPLLSFEQRSTPQNISRSQRLAV
jgi:hypothetical protein